MTPQAEAIASIKDILSPGWREDMPQRWGFPISERWFDDVE